MASRTRALVAGLLGAGAATLAMRALTSSPPGGAARWERTNHAGEPITLLEGPAYSAGAAVAVALTPGLPRNLRTAGVLATAGAAVFGAIDDLTESGKHKGLRGHLGELAHGRLSTGGLKVLGIGATALSSAYLTPSPRDHAVVVQERASRLHDHGGKRGGGVAGLADLAVAAGVVAGSANLANLLDLRPGRALKVVLLFAPGAASASPAGALVAAASGAAVALLPADLAARSMLGDTGANAAGALLGTAAVAGFGRRGRAALFAGLVALTLVSEKVSFTAVIERTPGLREFDRLGRG